MKANLFRGPSPVLLQNEAAARPKWSYQFGHRGPPQSFWPVGCVAYSELQGMGPAAYPAQTNANNFSAAFSENQQPIFYYSSYTQKCFFLNRHLFKIAP